MVNPKLVEASQTPDGAHPQAALLGHHDGKPTHTNSKIIRRTDSGRVRYRSVDR
jgi:hypothetical protein